MRRRLRFALLAVLALGLLGLLLAAPDYVRGLSLVLRATGRHGGWAGTLTSWRTQPVEVTELQVPSRHGPLRARFYRPREHRGHTVVLTSGVHADGIDEPRLVMLARALSTEGVPVLTPEPVDLLRYEITPRLTDMVEDAATWTASQPSLAPDGKVSLFGISFSGGLSVVAAGRPGLKDKVAATLSFGGHGDLSRVLAFLCTGVKPDGQRLKPHDYGVVVILLNVAGQLVPSEQVEPLREAIRTFLRASHLTLTDPRRAEETFEEARRMQARLPEPAARLMGSVNTRDVAALGPLLLPFMQSFAADPSLSPERSPPPSAPVYLLHGADDTVIPAIESALLREALAPHTEVHRLATPLITHAEFDPKTGLADSLNLIALWSGLLSE
ncbi:alpha/beta hydrolase [Stigmatella erecta]|uniref:Dienelactone hydrolase n=1 Tax=Stigmatella erecta TaxID=83460 RepID=A0A1I0LAA4_9BACT|nr:alpha/beta hydrolase [Stigmatella erecta]SEU37042.1 Dienelactone hydrolase [Stigmatella erecta]